MHDLVNLLHHLRSSFLMFRDMLLILISCILIFDLSRRKIVVETMSLTQKSLNFNIFLLSSKIALKIINFLNFLIFTIFLRAVSILSMFDLRVRAIIFCICFIFCFSLIHIINFISLFDFRFEKTLISRKKALRSRSSTV